MCTIIHNNISGKCSAEIASIIIIVTTEAIEMKRHHQCNKLLVVLVGCASSRLGPGESNLYCMLCRVVQQLQLIPHVLGGFASLAIASLLINFNTSHN